MKTLPSASVHEQAITYMPWGKLLKEVADYVSKYTREGGIVLDMFCGPGHLLGKIHEERPDLHCRGVDIRSSFIEHAWKEHPGIDFEVADARTWKTEGTNKKFDVVICTGGVYHLPYVDQEPFIERLSSLVDPEGYAVIADTYTEDHEDGKEHSFDGFIFAREYVAAMRKNGAPPEIVEAATKILRNDGIAIRRKTSFQQQLAIMKSRFRADCQWDKTWPANPNSSGFGHYWFITNPEHKKRERPHYIEVM